MGQDWPFEVVIARCFAFVGPALLGSSGSAAAHFIESAANGKGIVVQGTGEAVRSYQYAADMARWLLSCLVGGAPGRAYNVGDATEMTIAQLAGEVTRVAANGMPVTIAGRPTPGLAGPRYVPDVRRAAAELGLRNAVGLEEGDSAHPCMAKRRGTHFERSHMKPSFKPSTLRKTVVEMAFAGNAVHLGCAFSIIELVSRLYGRHMRYDEANPDDPDRDYLVLSKGHGVMAQYACLYELGWLERSDVDNYFHDGSRLKGLSDAHVPGCEVTSGTLGHGLSVGVGLALAAARKKSGQKVYAMVGDGEINEGPIWEAMLFAAHAKLDNLMVIVDANGFQAMGTTDEVMKLGDLNAKFAAFDSTSCRSTATTWMPSPWRSRDSKRRRTADRKR